MSTQIVKANPAVENKALDKKSVFNRPLLPVEWSRKEGTRQTGEVSSSSHRLGSAEVETGRTAKNGNTSFKVYSTNTVDFAELRRKYAEAKGTSRTEAKAIIHAAWQKGDLARIESELVLAVALDNGLRLPMAPDGSLKVGTFTHDKDGKPIGFALPKLVMPKVGKASEAPALPAPSLESQLASLSDDEFQQLVAARAASVASVA